MEQESGLEKEICYYSSSVKEEKTLYEHLTMPTTKGGKIVSVTEQHSENSIDLAVMISDNGTNSPQEKKNINYTIDEAARMLHDLNLESFPELNDKNIKVHYHSGKIAKISFQKGNSSPQS